MRCFTKAPGALQGTKSLLMTRFQSRIGRAPGFQPTGIQLLHAASQHASRRLLQPVLSKATSASAGEAFSSTSTSDAPRICVLGGGFGGLYTAIKLESLIWPKGKKPQVTLIDQNERFVFKPLLYELLNETAGVNEVAPAFDQVLAPYPIKFMQSKVCEVQPRQDPASAGAAGSVLLSSGEQVEYDWLVVALGAEVDARGVPGVREHAVPFSSYEDAIQIKAKLESLAAGSPSSRGSVVIVGAGYTGVELASVVAERLRGAADIRLVTPGGDILEHAPQGQRQAAARALAADGVQVMTGLKVRSIAAVGAEGSGRCVVNVSSAYNTAPPPAAGDSGTEDASGTASSSQIEADLVVWTAGLSPVTKAARQGFPFPTNPRGSLETEPTLQVCGSARTFALGDISMAQPYDAGEGASFPATAQVAFQQADYVAWNLWASINNRPQLPFRYQHLGDMMSLGQLNAAVALPVSLPAALQQQLQDSPLGPALAAAGIKLADKVTLEGPLAAALRRAAYLYRQPTNEQRASVAAGWVAQAAEAAPKVLQQIMSGAPLPGRSS